MIEKKALIVDNGWHGLWGKQLADNLKSFISDVNYVDVSLAKARKSLFDSSKKYRQKKQQARDNYLLMKIEEYRPDIFISVNYDKVTAECFDLLDIIGSKSFIWLGDSCFNFDYKLFNNYDHVAIYDKYYADILEIILNKKVEYLPTCANQEIYKPIKNNRDIDILFIGNLGEQNTDVRLSIMTNIISKFSDKNIHIYGGDKWKSHYVDYPELKGIYKEKLVDPIEANDLYNRSKIVINVDHPKTITSTCQRTYEIALSGAFQLCNYKESIANEFFPADTMVYFKNIEDLIDNIGQYLDDAESRYKTAAKAYMHALKNHTYKNRIETILKMIGE